MGKIFMRGLIALTPIALTIAIIIWLFQVLEGAFSIPLQKLIGKEYYFRGLGILVSFTLIFFVGIIINNWLMQRIYAFGEKILKKIPLVKTLYGSIRDVMSFFDMGKKKQGERIVTLELFNMRLIGIVTREEFEGLPEGIGKEDEICVYIPLSYQIGGFTVVVPRSHVHAIDMSVEQGMRFAVTAGASGEKKPEHT